MDTREAILTRTTAHRYDTRPIPEGAIERALEAAITAPNHKLTNPWRFIRVGEQTRKKLEDLYVEHKSKGRELNEIVEKKYRTKVGNPPELVVVTQVLADDEFRRKEDYASVSCAIHNITLSLWAEGVSSKWSTGSFTTHVRVYEMLDVDERDEEIVGFIWAGYPESDVEKPPRRPVDEVTRRVP
jgi:nitroreductase